MKGAISLNSETAVYGQLEYIDHLVNLPSEMVEANRLTVGADLRDRASCPSLNDQPTAVP